MFNVLFSLLFSPIRAAQSGSDANCDKKIQRGRKEKKLKAIDQSMRTEGRHRCAPEDEDDEGEDKLVCLLSPDVVIVAVSALHENERNERMKQSAKNPRPQHYHPHHL